MKDRLNRIEAELNQLVGKRNLLKEQIKNKQISLKKLQEEHVYTQEARTVIQKVAKDTQKQLEYRLSHLVSLAMESVFDDPYELKVEFVERRNKTEIDLFLEKDGERVEPMLSCGGGVVDVIAFALQLSILCLITPKVRNTLILDEPLKWLKGGDLPEKGSLMIQEISDKLGIQIISVSHSPEIIEASDHVIAITQKKGISHVQSEKLLRSRKSRRNTRTRSKRPA